MKKAKRIYALILAALMLSVFVVNVSASDTIICREYTLPCKTLDLDNKVVNSETHPANIKFVPSITPTTSGHTNYRISNASMMFDLAQISSAVKISH